MLFCKKERRKKESQSFVEGWCKEFIAQRLFENISLFLSKKIAIYPYGAVGKETERLLKERFETETVYRVDDNCVDGAITLDDFSKIYNEDVLIIFAVQNQALFRDLLGKLFLNGFKASKILILSTNMLLGSEAIKKVLTMKSQKPELKTLLDIGCGQGLQGRIFQDYGFDVTGLTMSHNKGYAGECLNKVEFQDFMNYETIEKFDVVWASHILEHIPDIQPFVNSMLNKCNSGGIIAITVPAREKSIMLAHVHSLSAGRLLRYLLCAGIDCRNAQILEYGYNLSVIIPTVKLIDKKFDFIGMQNQSADFLAQDKLFDYLPKEIKLNTEWNGIRTFDGDITELNWKEEEN